MLEESDSDQDDDERNDFATNLNKTSFDNDDLEHGNGLR